ncbi:hypothetical protein BCR37DRAFT_389401 [Protomyces lactucae-debilis]|uniref:Uncharacterized protein n=1 Tax=Protomyces lactucae-debilis TaxID=2754530 RepID=A0A1Y2EXH8_PROLT|nr:uncharacterized protein BCR37DRAFT_389401 [Protomyces lactucae-debilis]ORY76299.1 hypothetical protein BCR37DRAFT_389401 [Protomyces lactucae-debilis]
MRTTAFTLCTLLPFPWPSTVSASNKDTVQYCFFIGSEALEYQPICVQPSVADDRTKLVNEGFGCDVTAFSKDDRQQVEKNYPGINLNSFHRNHNWDVLVCNYFRTDYPTRCKFNREGPMLDCKGVEDFPDFHMKADTK